MCYKCEVPGCGKVVPAGSPQKRHAIERVRPTRVSTVVHEKDRHGNRIPQYKTVEINRTEIVREFAVCHECHKSLSLGVSLAQLTRFLIEKRKRREREAALLLNPHRKVRVAGAIPCGDDAAEAG